MRAFERGVIYFMIVDEICSINEVFSCPNCCVGGSGRVFHFPEITPKAVTMD